MMSTNFDTHYLPCSSGVLVRLWGVSY